MIEVDPDDPVAYVVSMNLHPKYIWRYTEPSRQQQEQALEDLF